ncbi:MAG: DUF3592 domain-containing protein [Chloroflexota bacterium]
MNRVNRMSSTTVAILEILTILFVMAGVFILIVDGGKAYESYRSESWPTTTGEITRSAVDASADFNDNRWYHSRIKYAYRVEEPGSAQPANDDYLIGTRIGIDPAPKAESRAAAQEIIALYPKGSSVEVYYNPNNPSRSMLKPKFLRSYLIMPVVGVLCLGVAFGLRKIVRRHKL